MRIAQHMHAMHYLALAWPKCHPHGVLCSCRCAPPDYGLQRMAQEAVLGPQGIFKPAPGKSKQAAAAADASDDDAGSGSEDEGQDGPGSDSGERQLQA